MVYEYCRKRRCFAEVKAFFRKVLAKEALCRTGKRKVKEVRLILDNGSIHAPKLEEWLAEQQQENDIYCSGTLAPEVRLVAGSD